MLPNERMGLLVSGERTLTHDLAAVVECVGEDATASERIEIDHSAFFPEKSVQSQRSATAMRVRRRNRIDRIRLPNDLSRLVNEQRLRVSTAQGAQILHHSVLPEEGPRLRYQALERIGVINRVAREPDQMAAVIDGIG